MTPKHMQEKSQRIDEAIYSEALQESEEISLVNQGILLVDDHEHLTNATRLLLKAYFKKFESAPQIYIAHSIAEAEKILASENITLMVLDKDLGEDDRGHKMDGVDHIPQFLQLSPDLLILMFSGYSDSEYVVQAMKFGAFTYIPKDAGNDYFLEAVRKALLVAKMKLQLKLGSFKSEKREEKKLLKMPGKSFWTRKMNKQIKLLSESMSVLLLRGEQGTGKKLASKVLYNQIQGKKEKNEGFYQSLDLSLFPDREIEEKIFGIEDSGRARKGLLECVQNGVLYLEHIDSVGVALQKKFLSLLEEKQFCRVGGDTSFAVKTRLVFSSEKDLEKLVSSRSFDRDLYVYLNTFTLDFESFETRAEDIPSMIALLLPNVCERTGIKVDFEDFSRPFLRFVCENPPERGIKGIELLLEKLLIYSPKDLDKKPSFKFWKKTLESYYSQYQKMNPALDASTINIQRLLKIDTDFLRDSSSFPGIKEAVQIFEDKILQEALNESTSVSEVAKKLKIVKSTAWRKIELAKERKSIKLRKSFGL